MKVKRRQNQQNNVYVHLAVTLFLINAMCKYFLPGIVTKILPIMAVAIVVTQNKEPFKVCINRIDKPYLVFLFIWLLGCLYSVSLTKGFGYVFSFAIAILFGVFSWKQYFNEKKIIKLLSVFCTILVVAIILQPLMPQTISNINQLFGYSAKEYTLMKAWTRNEWYTGLFPDRAPAAFFCSILIGTGMFYMFSNDKYKRISGKFVGAILAIIGVYGILLTVKRGLFLGAIIAAFCSFVLYKKAKMTSIWKIILLAVVAVIIVFFVFKNVDATQVMWQRFFENDDVMTGRTEIYSDMIDVIWSNLLLGTGTASAFSILGVGGHNIYLTVLMENGVIGFAAFIVAIVYCIYSTITLALRIGKRGWFSKLPFLMFSFYIQIFFVIYGMSGNPLYDNYILYFYLFAVLIVKNIDYQCKHNTYRMEEK